jgi:DNA primase small subunit
MYIYICRRQLKNAITAPKNPPQAAKKVKTDYTELNAWRVELVFTHCYPRLDANVSKSQNHLLKSPFCIHPKTGRVCVPIDPSSAEKFDPFSVPTVRTLCAEVDEYDKLHPDTKDIPDIQKTSMKGAIEIFEKTFWKSLCTTIRKDFKDKSDRSAAMTVDF